MPNPLAIVLHASAAETASGVTSPVIDLADRTFAQITLDVTALSSAATLAVVIETSVLGTDWRTARAFEIATALGTKQVNVASGDRFMRARWTITGSTPSITFVINGTAHQLYCLPSDIALYGIPSAALNGVPVEVLAEKCLAASDEAAGYLDGAYTLPLVSWGTDLREKVACMATLKLMRFRGYAPDSGKDDTIKDASDEALVWLNRIANGKLRPTTIVDTTPLIRETEVYVESEWPRGWGGGWSGGCGC